MHSGEQRPREPSGTDSFASHSSSFVNLEQMASSADANPDTEGEEVEYIEEVVEYEEEEVEEEVTETGTETEAEPATPQKSAAPAETPQAPEPEPEPTAAAAEEQEPAPAAEEEPAAPDGGEKVADSAPLPELAEEPARKPEPASTSTASAPAGGTAGVDLDLKQLEAQAAKVASEVSKVALDVSSKLTAGFRSALGGIGGGGDSSGGSGGGGGGVAASGAGASLSKLAGGLSSWWGSLDPAPQPVRDETAERVAASNKASGELQQLFGLSAEENLVEHFRCKLLQTYACSHNPHTPAIQMAFQGTLYVTDKHTCFSVEERGRKLPFKVPHSAVVRATRQRAARKGDLSDILKMELSNGQWLAFKDFDSGSSLDSALALVEHLMEGS